MRTLIDGIPWVIRFSILPYQRGWWEMLDFLRKITEKNQAVSSLDSFLAAGPWNQTIFKKFIQQSHRWMRWIGAHYVWLKVTALFQFIQLRCTIENEFLMTFSCYNCSKRKLSDNSKLTRSTPFVYVTRCRSANVGHYNSW